MFFFSLFTRSSAVFILLGADFLFFLFFAFLRKKPIPWICRADLNAHFSEAEHKVV